MSANKELIGKVLRSIAEHPALHEQAEWIGDEGIKGEAVEFDLDDFENECGTTACIAGWALLHEGYTFRFEAKEDGEWGPYTDLHAVKGDEEPIGTRTFPDVASQLMGGDDYLTASRFFDLFFTNGNEEAIAELMYAYENGEPPLRAFPAGMEPVIEWLPKTDFITKWYGKFEKEFGVVA